MLKTCFAYLLAFVTAPTIGALAQLVILPLSLLPLLTKDETHSEQLRRWWMSALLNGLSCVLSGFVAVWFARWLFRWLGVSATFWLAGMLGLGFFFHDTSVIRRRPLARALHVVQLIGDLVGVYLGAIHFLA
jgi:hypothetical protein